MSSARLGSKKILEMEFGLWISRPNWAAHTCRLGFIFCNESALRYFFFYNSKWAMVFFSQLRVVSMWYFSQEKLYPLKIKWSPADGPIYKCTPYGKHIMYIQCRMFLQGKLYFTKIKWPYTPCGKHIVHMYILGPSRFCHGHFFLHNLKIFA